MIKVILRLDCGVGMDSADAYLITREDWDDYNGADFNAPIFDTVWQMAVDHAAMYGIYPESERPDEDDENSFGGDEYSEDINGHLELYDPKKHDGLKAGGGEWEWDTVL